MWVIFISLDFLNLFLGLLRPGEALSLLWDGVVPWEKGVLALGRLGNGIPPFLR